MEKYSCIICNNEFKSPRKLHPLLQICKECRKTHRAVVKDNQVKVQREVSENQKEYWRTHPEEYKEFLQKRKEKRDATKIEKYGSLENAEKCRMKKQLITLKEKYPDEDWGNITNPNQLKVTRENIKKK